MLLSQFPHQVFAIQSRPKRCDLHKQVQILSSHHELWFKDINMDITIIIKFISIVALSCGIVICSGRFTSHHYFWSRLVYRLMRGE